MPSGENTILQGKIVEPLIKFAIPMMLTLLLQALYGAVDLIIVGKFGSTVSASAVSNGSQIMQTVSEFITGLAMGVTVLVGRFVGAKDDEQAAKTVGGMIKLFIIVGVVLTIIMEVFAYDIAALMKVPEEARAKTVEYLRICSAGLIFITAFNVIGGLFRGLGNSKSPLLFITIACVTNVFGDLLLVAVFKLDVAGAAIATVFSQGLSVVFSIVLIIKNKLPFIVERRHLKKTKSAQGQILKIGAPVALQSFLVSTSFLIIMAIINNISLVASVSVGISEKLFALLALIPISFMYALSAFVAQNVGAKQEHRAVKALGAAMIVSASIGVVTFLLTFLAGDTLAWLFVRNDPIVISSTQSYLRGISFEYLVVPMVFCFLGYFNGIGKTTFVLVEGLVSSFAVRIPLCYYFSKLPNTNLMIIGYSVPISSVVCLLMCGIYYIAVRKKRISLHIH